MSDPIFLVRLVLDRRAVLRIGVRHRLGQAADEGALLHAGLAQLFAQSTERAQVPLLTFAIDDMLAASLQQPDRLFLLGYSAAPRERLLETMGPAREQLLLQCEAREMPFLERGRRLGFRTRVCPVVRTRQEGRRELALDQHGRRRHREMDVFVHATLRQPAEEPSREAVYVHWLRRQLERARASSLEAACLSEFRREVMRRRTAARIERPNAVLQGTLLVDDPAAFTQLLARGVGRHRAFGFGMLLLRPPEA